MGKTSNLTLYKLIAVLFPINILVLTARISSSPFWFTYLEIGKLVGPVFGLILLRVLLVVTPFGLFAIFYPHISRSMILSKLKTRRIQKLIILSSIISLILVVLLQFGFLLRVSQEEIDNFVNQNAGVDLESFVNNIPDFLEENIRSAYKRPEALFRIDLEVFNSIIDYQMMKCMGITRADLIIYQGWGTCGQTAVVIEQLLHEFGYDSRRAWFIGRDHEWAEVKNDTGKWQIIDPYIGYLIDIEDLGSDQRFSDASGAIVRFRNGTIVDMSEEHGYR